MKLPPDDEMGIMKDWRKALRSPPAYRIVNRTLRQQTQFVIWVSLIGLVILILLYTFPSKSDVGKTNRPIHKPYNHTYPLTRPINSNGMYTFRIGSKIFIIFFYLLVILSYNLCEVWYSRTFFNFSIIERWYVHLLKSTLLPLQNYNLVLSNCSVRYFEILNYDALLFHCGLKYTNKRHVEMNCSTIVKFFDICHNFL